MLIALDWTRPKDPPLSLGHASILANLQAHHIDVRAKQWSVNHDCFDSYAVVNFVLSLSPTTNTYVAFGVFVWNEYYVQKIIQTLKKHKFPGKIILGGPQISYVKSQIETFYPEADIFIRGYAEDALTQFLLDEEDFPTIRGIHYANQPSLNLTAITDLTHLPSPFLGGILSKQKFIRWETQRGCPFRCSFCQHREADPTQTRRAFPSQRIQEEINWLIEENIVQDIAVLDPTFNSGDSYYAVLTQFAKRQYKGKLALQCRIEMVTPAFLEAVQAININGRVVLEFGLQTIHKKEQSFIQRPNNMNKVSTILQEVEQYGIESEVSLIFGLPGQTLQSFKESVNFCQNLGVKIIHAFPLMLLRGTLLYEQKKELGLIESTDVNFTKIPRIQNNIPHVISSPTFSYEDWLKMGELAEQLEIQGNATHNSKA